MTRRISMIITILVIVCSMLMCSCGSKESKEIVTHSRFCKCEKCEKLIKFRLELSKKYPKRVHKHLIYSSFGRFVEPTKEQVDQTKAYDNELLEFKRELGVDRP